MRLLFDQNLSFRLCTILNENFPESNQVRLIGLDSAQDLDVWNYAAANGFVLVSKDADFAEMAALKGPPPKVIWLRCGNEPTSIIAERLRANLNFISEFVADDSACIELY